MGVQGRRDYLTREVARSLQEDGEAWRPLLKGEKLMSEAGRTGEPW